MVRNFIFIGFAASAVLASSRGSSQRSEVWTCANGLERHHDGAAPSGVTGPGVSGCANNLEYPQGLQGVKPPGRSPNGDTLEFIWWNLQNLFDTVANSGPRDRDFLPEGPYRWDSKRYYAKLYAVGRGLAAAAGGRVPDAVGVCEVENADVLDDLERRWPPEWRLWRLHRDSPDARGIDVAVWYNPQRLRVDSVAWISPGQDYPTREALWVRWITPNGDTLTWLWAHLPSQRAPSPNARRDALKSVFRTVTNAPDGLCGDLNEGSEGPLGTWLRSRKYTPTYPTNLSGSFAYRGRLEALDGIWSQELKWEVGSVRAVPFGLSQGARGYQIRGTFEGLRYCGGASDHLPLRYTVARKQKSAYFSANLGLSPKHL